ncbi:MAG: hypothetical protein ACE5G1_17260 [bacterium]
MMPVATLRKITEKWGVSLEDSVRYQIKGNKGIIEIDLKASEKEIELAGVKDTSEDFLSEEELNYYLKLEEL